MTDTQTALADVRVEELLDRAWPVLEAVRIGVWTAYASRGVTGRANSVRPNAEPDDLDATLAEVEAFYAARGLPTRIRLTPRSRPSDLDEVLADRGYELVTPTMVCVAEGPSALAALATRPAPVHDATVTDEPDEEWLSFWHAAENRTDPSVRDTAVRIITGIPARYVMLRVAGEPAAIGRLTPVDGYAFLHSLSVRPDLRGKGFGTALLRAMVADAGSASLGLQVTKTNTAARTLYANAGFRDAWPYHYRVRPMS